jgi:hypothetical protein
MSAKLFVVLALGAAVGWLATGPPKDIVAADRSRLSCQGMHHAHFEALLLRQEDTL